MGQPENSKLYNRYSNIALYNLGNHFYKGRLSYRKSNTGRNQTEEAIVIESDDNLEEIEEETPDTQKVEIVDALEHLFSYLYPNSVAPLSA